MPLFQVNSTRSSILLFVAICYLSASVYSRQIGKRNGNPKFYNPNEIELLRRSKAADIKSWIETTEDPCNDFYSYVCGNWPRIYADEVLQQGTINKYSELNRAMDKRIQKFIGTLRAGDAIEGKIRNFYQSCLNAKADACEYIEDLKTIYEEFGKFSFQKKKGVVKSKTSFNWWSTAAGIFNAYGYGFIIDIKVVYDLQNVNKTMMIYLKEPTTKLNSADKAQLEDCLIKYYGASVEDAEYVVRDVLTFEKAMSEAKTDSDDSNEVQYSLHNLTTVHRHYRDLFDVESFLKTALNLAEVPPQIYIQHGGYFDNLLNIFENTKPDTVEDYLLWLLAAEYLIDVDTEDMKSLCAGITNLYFTKYLQHTIYQEFRSNEFEMQIHDLWQDIKSVFLEDIHSEKYLWLSTAARDHVAEKLNSIEFKISSYDEEKFEDFFKGLRIDSLKYVKNLQNIHKHIQARRGNGLQTTSNSIDNFEDYSFSAFYVSSLNAIRIPVAILLPFHLWHPAYPKAILYATIGSSLAMEMINAFDDASNWWDENSASAFEERRHCFQAQYQNYTNGDRQRVPDHSTQLQHIAGNSAVKIAYSAYMRWINSDNQKENRLIGETLPSMSYNNQELFFISYGQRWCEGTTEDELDKKGGIQLRVTAVLSNFEKFGEVFKCDPDAAMNPVKKCTMF